VTGVWVFWANTYGLDPWDRIDARILVDEHPSEGATFLSSKGAFGEWPGGSRLYTVNPKSAKVFEGSTYYRPVAFGKLWPHGTAGIELISGGGGKGEVDPRLMVRPGRIEFTDRKGRRISVDY
jgi:hypothetical protein